MRAVLKTIGLFYAGTNAGLMFRQKEHMFDRKTKEKTDKLKWH